MRSAVNDRVIARPNIGNIDGIVSPTGVEISCGRLKYGNCKRCGLLSLKTHQNIPILTPAEALRSIEAQP